MGLAGFLKKEYIEIIVADMSAGNEKDTTHHPKNRNEMVIFMTVGWSGASGPECR